MARQVLPIVGAAVGFFIGGPAGAQWGYAIGALVGNIVDPVVINGPKIGDVATQTSAEGVYQPIYFGTAAGAGNIIMQGPDVIKKNRDSGKGGPVTVTERLYRTFAIRIGVSWQEGEGIVAVTRIWEDNKLVYDIRPESEIVADSSKFAEQFTLHLGTQDQLPDPDLEALPALYGGGMGNVPSYRGRAYIVFPNKDITDRKSISDYRLEVVTQGVSIDRQLIAFRIFQTPNMMSIDDAWAGAWSLVASPANANRAVVARDRIITLSAGSAGPYYYTDDFGNTFTASTGAGVAAGGGFFRGWARNDIVMMANGAADANVSTNRGESFAAMPGIKADAFASIDITPTSALWVRLRNNFGSRSTDNGITWTAEVATGLIAGGEVSRWSDGVTIMFGGRSGLGAPAIRSTTGGVSFTTEVMPTFGGSATITCICEGNGIWVAGTDTGEIIYRDISGVWQMASDTLGAHAYDVTHTGSAFAMIGSQSGIGNPGFIKSSVDGDTWTTRFNDNMISSSEAWNTIVTTEPVHTVISAPLPLSSIVDRIHEMCNRPAAQHDSSDLDDIEVTGLVLAGGYSGADSIRTAQGLYQFDSAEFNGKINYSLRGKPVVYTFTIDDLMDEPEESIREQAIEYPLKMHLDYQSPFTGYAPAKATSSRSSNDIRVLGEANIQSPFVFADSDEPQQRVTILHKVSWADADGEVTFTVPDKFLWIAPGDCVGLQLRDTIRRLRIDKIEYADGVMKLTCRNDRQSAYTSDVTGVPIKPPDNPPTNIVGPSVLELLDIAALRDADDLATPVWYKGIGGVSPAWYGATEQDSTDGGANYTGNLMVSNGTVMGTMLEDVADASQHYTDTTNVVRVQLDRYEEIDSLTDSQFLSEQGGFALSNPDGTWELCQFRDADDLGDGLYEFSHLLRGRLNSGTEEHLAGARFVLLDTIIQTQAPSSYLGQDIYHRAISFGNSPETATVKNAVFAGRSQIEWPIANLFLERDGDDILIEIIPRHRFGTEDVPVRSINWDGYRLEISDGSILSAFTITSDTHTFDATGWSSPIQVAVAQRNRITGTGPFIAESIA